MLRFPDRLSANNRRLGHLLLQRGFISESQLLYALDLQHHRPQPLGALLQQLGWITHARLKSVLRQQQRLGLTAQVVATLLPQAKASALARDHDSSRPLIELPEVNCWLTTELDAASVHSLLKVRDLTLLCGTERSCAFFALENHLQQPLMLRAPIRGFISHRLASGLTDYWASIELEIRLDGKSRPIEVLLRPEQPGEGSLPRLSLATEQLLALAPGLAPALKA